ncbi:MAG: replication factor C large subunit [Methanophagales archaeon]|nr:replication factor C large subunit [Methanophagales archaeon]
MRESSVEWTEKYRPKKLRDVLGNEEAIEKLTEWSEEVFKAKSKKAALLVGPAGCGKTSAAYALASEREWEVIELNASDQRSEGVIKRIVGPASTSTTFSQTTRLIILDEADNLHGKEDRGGTKAITEIVKRSTQPLILTANDKYKMGKGLLRGCKTIEFKRLDERIISRALRKISRSEGIEIESKALHALIENAHGDLRSAINDLQALSMSDLKLEGISEGEIATGERDVEEDIFEVLKKIFGMDGYELQEALSSLYALDKTPEESIQWIYKNFSYGYDEESFLHGLRYLSRADIFLGRVRRRENFKFWRYASSLMACGVLSAQEMQVGKRAGWERRKQQYFRSPWQRQQRSGEERKSAPIREEIAKKVANYCKVPLSYARFFILPFLTILFGDERKAAEITASLRLEVPHIAVLVSDTDEGGEEKTKRIYQDALAIAVRKGKERVVEAAVGDEVIKPRKAVSVKEEGEEGEEGEEAKNQKTLADFF